MNVFEACRYTGVKKVIFSSSVAAYGEPGSGVTDETSPADLAGKTVTKQLRQGRCSLNSECYSVAF